MKLKLDENLGSRRREMLAAAGHDVATVVEQAMVSASDEELIGACKSEQRALITLDLDFSNPLIFPPAAHAGVAVLRLPRKQSHSHLVATVATLVEGLRREKLTGKLWTVEIGRLRIYQPVENEGA